MPKITILITEEEKTLWVQAAHGELVSLTEFLRRAANARSLETGALGTSDRDVPAVRASSTSPIPAARDQIAPPAEVPSVPAVQGAAPQAQPRASAENPGKAKKKKDAGGGLCPHRVPLGSYCKRCEEEV